MSENNNKDDRYEKLPETEISTDKINEPSDTRATASPSGEAAVSKSKFALWLENFFYHYKWHTAAVAFVLIVAIVCTVTMCGRKKADVMIIYAGNCEISTNRQGKDVSTHELLLKALESIGKEGEMTVSLSSYWWLSNNEIEARNSDDDPNNNISSAQDDSIYSGFQEFDNLMTLGGSSQYYIWFMSPALYEYYAKQATKNDRDIELVFTNLKYLEKHSSTIQFYDTEHYTAIKLASLPAYSQFSSVLPEDTLVVLRAPSGLSKWSFGRKHKNAFEKSEAYLIDLID